MVPLDLHLSPNTRFGIRLRDLAAQPAGREGFRFSARRSERSRSARQHDRTLRTRLERAHHQEFSISRRIGNNHVQVAGFSDRVDNTALTGTGEVTSVGGFLLPDIYSGTFSYAGGTLDTHGLRVVLERKVCSDLTATLDYAYGGVLDLAKPDVELQDAQQWITTQRRQAVAAKLSGTVSRTHTRWIASYRWVDGQP